MEIMQKRLGNFVYEERNIGGGQFSEVYLGYELRSQERVAIKQIDCSKMKDQVMIQMMKNEIGILKTIPKQSNILKLYDVFQNNQNVYIITEYCNQGDLQQLIKKRQLSEEEVLELISQILNGLQHCKNNFIIHRDIKSANILLNNNVPKLADFGFALCKHVQNGVEIQNYNVGTPMYMAPETLINNHYSFKSDIWSTGVVLYEMLFGQYPFKSYTEQELVQKYRRYQQNGLLYYPFQCSRYIDILIQNMLQYDKTKRWGVEQCVEYLKNKPAIQRSVSSQRLVVQPQHVRSVTPVQMRQQTVAVQYQQQFKISQQPSYQVQQLSQLPTQQLSQLSTQQLTQVPTSQLSQLPTQQLMYLQQQSLHFSNPSPQDLRTSTENTIRYPSAQRERNNTLLNSNDSSQRLESNQSNIYSLQFGNLLYKVAKLFINTQYFDVFSLGKNISKFECTFLQLKIQFCMLQCCLIIFPNSNPSVNECTIRHLNVKQQILKMPEWYIQDSMFMSLFNNQWKIENIFELLQGYLYQGIYMFNDYLALNCNNSQLIIILDYLVIIYKLLKRFKTCTTWMEFDRKNNIAVIVEAYVNPNASYQQWIEISKIIHKDIVK